MSINEPAERRCRRTNLNKVFKELVLDLETKGICQTISPKMQGKLRQYYKNRLEGEIIAYSINYKIASRENDSYFDSFNRKMLSRYIYWKRILKCDFIEALLSIKPIYLENLKLKLVDKMFEPNLSEKTIHKIVHEFCDKDACFFLRLDNNPANHLKMRIPVYEFKLKQK